MAEHANTPEKTIGTAWCPDHGDTRRTGLLRQGNHVVWRIHDRVTHGGVRIQCRASGAPLCTTGDANEQHRDETPHPTCTHPTAPGPP